MSSDGSALSRPQDAPVTFVEGALAGERVEAVVVRDAGSFRRARLARVLEPSPDRVVPPCPEHARGCGGCPWQHIEPGAQRRMKRRILTEALARLGGITLASEPAEVALEGWGRRTSARAGVRKARAGFRRARSHEVLALSGCPLVHPLLEEMLCEGRFPQAREVRLRVAEASGDRSFETDPAWAATKARLGGLRAGEPVVEEVAGRHWRVSPQSFFQSRRDGAEALAGLVARAVGSPWGGARALDLYSGVGLFAGVLADAGWEVEAVEAAESACADARANLAGAGVEVVRADAATYRPERFELVVADPPRAGLGRQGVEVIRSTQATKVVLVGCDAPALARDCGLLVRAGYALESVELVDVFSHSFRVEAVAVLTR